MMLWLMIDAEETLIIPTRVPSQAAPRAQYDPSYFERHGGRNQGRLQSIMAHLPPGERLLDIGCNRGYFSRAALELGLAQRVDGVEPSRDRVDPELLADPRFTLHEGDIFELELPETYHAVFYCAVHHHIFGHRGRAAAFGLWQRIVDRCERHLFFETGQLLEGSRWYWQRALRSHYPSDEQHLAELLQAVGPRLAGNKVVGEYAIHGTRRWLLRIDLRDREVSPPRRAAQRSVDRYEVLENLRRSVGSRRQQLVRILAPAAQGSVAGVEAPLHDGVIFKRCRDRLTGELLWCKRRPSDPWRDERELLIGRQLSDDRFVRARELDPELGLIFPYVPGEKLSAVDLRRLDNRTQFLDELIDLYELAARTPIATGDLDIDPRQRHSERALIDLVDLNPSNILVAREGRRLRLLGVIDLEYYRNHNRARNALHLAQLLRGGRARSPRALRWLAWASYQDVVDRLRWDAASLEERLVEGRGTRARGLIMQAREARDHLLRWRPGYWQ